MEQQEIQRDSDGFPIVEGPLSQSTLRYIAREHPNGIEHLNIDAQSINQARIFLDIITEPDYRIVPIPAGIQAEIDFTKDIRIPRDQYSISWEKLLEIAIEIYGEESVDLIPSTKGKALIIYFPIINITNSEGSSHIIKDLYTQIFIETDRDKKPERFSIYNVVLSGSRATMTIKEVDSKYGHSHLHPIGIMGGSGTFCMGASAFGDLNMSLHENPVEDTWYIYLLSLGNYLSWESLEGGPYRKIKQIAYSSQESRESEILGSLTEIIQNLPTESLSFAGGLEFIEDKPAVWEFFNVNSPVRVIKGDRNTESVREVLQKASEPNLPFKFKGKDIPFTITLEETQPEEQGTIDPELIRRYNLLINNKLREFNKLIKYEYFTQRHNNDEKIGQTPVI